MRRIGWLAVVVSFTAFAGTPVALTPAQQQAIMDSGTQFGQGALSVGAGTINGTGGAAGVPSYNATPSGQAPGGAGLFGPATAKQAGCNGYTAPAGPGQVANQQDCAAVDFLTKHPNPKAAYPINPKTDPTIVAGKAILASARNGTAFTPGGGTPGSGDTTIPNGCVTTTNPTPAVTTTETCYLASSANAQTCDKTLSCNVTQPAPIPATAAVGPTCPSAARLFSGVVNGTPTTLYSACVPSPTCTGGMIQINIWSPSPFVKAICGTAQSTCPMVGTTVAFTNAGYATGSGTKGAAVCIPTPVTTYSCPTGYTLSGTTCIANPSATCTWTDGCTALQAKTL